MAPIRSLTVIEPTVFDLLRQAGELALYQQVTTMRAGYFRAFAGGEQEAARRVIDFYGGRDSFDALPQRMREYVVATTPSNIRDWRTGFDGPLPPFGDIQVPSHVLRGEHGHRAMARCTEILAGILPNAALTTVAGAGHFMIASHAGDVARLVSGAVTAREQRGTHELWSCEP